MHFETSESLRLVGMNPKYSCVGSSASLYLDQRNNVWRINQLLLPKYTFNNLSIVRVKPAMRARYQITSRKSVSDQKSILSGEKLPPASFLMESENNVLKHRKFAVRLFLCNYLKQEVICLQIARIL